MGRFDGKVAVLTGAASGIGRSVSVRLASEGAAVVGHDINADGLAETAEVTAAAGAGSFTPRPGDLASRDECIALVEAAVAEHGRLDILGNIAGIARAEHLLDVTEAGWHQMVAVNLSAPFWCAQAAIPHLLESAGTIINIASNAGLMGQAYTVPYCATKGAIVNMTRSMAMEFVKTDLRVNAIAPAGTETGLTRNFTIPDDVDWELIGRYTGFRGMAHPDEIAAIFAFLCSEEARPIHGAIVSADFGVTTG